MLFFRQPIFVVLLAYSSPVAASAQVTSVVAPGDRIRVTAPECLWVKQEATFVSFGENRFSAVVDDKDVSCPASALAALEVAQGERRWWKASLAGMGIGGVAVTLVGAGMEPDYASAAPLAGVILGMPAGFLVGTVVGWARGSVDWQNVPLPTAKTHLMVSTNRTLGFGFSISLRR